MLLSRFASGRIPREIVFAVAKGMYGRSNRCFKLAHSRTMKALQHSYIQRHRRKGQFRTHWIARMNPAAREYGLTYSRLIGGLDKANVHLNRKMLCGLAETEPVSFKVCVDEAKRIMWWKDERKDLSGL
eukprot:GEMP01116171.1.p1 GENE.GEMP01116171.1~~GEMP01116171.1.p1  ORF type:complete len:129 (+),score=11.21 GEMP01116171.1:86-472(+)